MITRAISIGVLLVAAAIVGACERPQRFSGAQAKKWVQQCGGRLIADAAVFYESITPEMSAEEIRHRIEAFLAAESSLLTLSLVEDEQGRPVGLALREQFWGRIVAPEAVKMQWRSQTQLLVKQVLVAAGIELPLDWNSAAAAPLKAWLGEAFPQIASPSTVAPFTARLKALRSSFATKEDFGW
ncbi:MAG: hypothetical protein MK101_00170 [Phycisphaerales bacterium]|nr:hypothetical protein [Phycisphaerales bacterium]